MNIEDVGSFDENLADKLYKQPAEHLPLFEEAATEVADELTSPRPDGEENVQDIQIMLSSDAHASDLRSLKVGYKILLRTICITSNFYCEFFGMLTFKFLFKRQCQQFKTESNTSNNKKQLVTYSEIICIRICLI